jgi:hypothetical protein
MKAKRYVVTHKRTSYSPKILCYSASFFLELTNIIYKILTEQYSFVKVTKERLLVQKTGQYLEKFDFDMWVRRFFVWSPITGTSDVMNSLSSLVNQEWVMSFWSLDNTHKCFLVTETCQQNEICGLMMLTES